MSRVIVDDIKKAWGPTAFAMPAAHVAKEHVEILLSLLDAALAAEAAQRIADRMVCNADRMNPIRFALSRDLHAEEVATIIKLITEEVGATPPPPLYCDVCGTELQRESCNHVRPCVKCCAAQPAAVPTAHWPASVKHENCAECDREYEPVPAIVAAQYEEGEYTAVPEQGEGKSLEDAWELVNKWRVERRLLDQRFITTQDCRVLAEWIGKRLSMSTSADAGIDSGVWFKSACSGLWYTNYQAAGDIAAIRIGGKVVSIKPESRPEQGAAPTEAVQKEIKDAD